jgi:4-hydroxy-3-methylbut-2-en-1-yl diphosphate reductase
MPEVIRARVCGYCMGVRRAMEIAEKTLSRNASTGRAAVYALGPLIHNRLAMNMLKARGLRVVDVPSEIEKGVVLIRAHGVAPSVREELVRRGVEIVDATCPRVLRSQESVTRYGREGYRILIIGDPDHGEVRAIQGCASTSLVIRNVSQTEELALPARTFVIAQTTLRVEEYVEVCDALREIQPRIEVADSICPATSKRQAALLDLIPDVDGVLVIGGMQSANTRRLYRTAAAHGVSAWHIEDVDGVPEDAFTLRRIGISAGASTPDSIIEGVERRLRENHANSL